MSDEWKPIELIASSYLVSSDGRVMRAGKARGAKCGRILRTYLNENGREKITIRVATGRKKQFFVHTLVAAAFVGPKPDGMEVNHKNGDKTDNRADNLEYLTRAENISHAIENNLSHHPPPMRGDSNPATKLTDMAVRVAYRCRQLGMSRREIATIFGVSRQTITDAIRVRLPKII